MTRRRKRTLAKLLSDAGTIQPDGRIRLKTRRKPRPSGARRKALAKQEGFPSVAAYRRYHRDPDLWFAQEVAKRFPPEDFPRVADVAGGYGHTAKALKKVGYVVETFDPEGERVKGVRLHKRKFWVRDARDFDLVVGFRPCGASQKLIRAGKYRPIAMIPCFCRSVWPPISRRKPGPKPKWRSIADSRAIDRWRRLYPTPTTGATKFFKTQGVPFDRIGPLFISKPTE